MLVRDARKNLCLIYVCMKWKTGLLAFCEDLAEQILKIWCQVAAMTKTEVDYGLVFLPWAPGEGGGIPISFTKLQTVINVMW